MPECHASAHWREHPCFCESVRNLTHIDGESTPRCFECAKPYRGGGEVRYTQQLKNGRMAVLEILREPEPEPGQRVTPAAAGAAEPSAPPSATPSAPPIPPSAIARRVTLLRLAWLAWLATMPGGDAAAIGDVGASTPGGNAATISGCSETTKHK
jgi:hypothetical protein